MRYEFSLSVPGETFWINEPSQIGANHDIRIHCQKLKAILSSTKLAAGDFTYKDIRCVHDDGLKGSRGT